MSVERGPGRENAGSFDTFNEQLKAHKGLGLSEAYGQGTEFITYGPHGNESFEDIAGKLAESAVSQDRVAVSVFEGLPVIALPGDTADSIKKRRLVLGILTKIDLTIGEVDDLGHATPELLVDSLTQECQRIMKSARIYTTEFGSASRGINLLSEKALLPFHFRGPDTPEWLRSKAILMSTDGGIIKVHSDPPAYASQQDYETPDTSGNSLYLNNLYYLDRRRIVPINEPFMGPGMHGTETIDEYFERMNGYGDKYNYRNLEPEEMKALLKIMRRVEPVRFIEED